MTEAETASTSTSTASASRVVVAEVYAKPYTESAKTEGPEKHSKKQMQGDFGKGATVAETEGGGRENSKGARSGGTEEGCRKGPT